MYSKIIKHLSMSLFAHKEETISLLHLLLTVASCLELLVLVIMACSASLLFLERQRHKMF